MPNIATLCNPVRVHINKMQYFSQMVLPIASIANQTAGAQRSASIFGKWALCSHRKVLNTVHILFGVCVTEHYECVIITRFTWETGKDAMQPCLCHFRASAMLLAANIGNKTGCHLG